MSKPKKFKAPKGWRKKGEYEDYIEKLTGSKEHYRKGCEPLPHKKHLIK